MQKYTKPYPTIGDIIDAAGHDFDYVSYRIPMNYKNFETSEDDDGEFAGCFRTENGIIHPLDGDSYSRDEPVLASEEWNSPEDGISNGLTVIIDVEYLTDEKFEKYLEEWKKNREKYNIEEGETSFV